VISYNIKQEQYINSFFTFGKRSSKGWIQNMSGCPYCADGSSKNHRSHFLFSNDEIGFQCFNCGKKHRFSSKNLNYFANFMAKASWKSVGSILLDLKKQIIFPVCNTIDRTDITINDNSISNIIDYKEIEFPGIMIPILYTPQQIAPQYKTKFKKNKKLALEYLEKQGLKNHKKIKELFIAVEGEYQNRLIMPIFFETKLISFAARALFPTKTKYLYPPSTDEFNDRGKIIYGLDNLLNSYSQQFFITESLIDTWVYGGLAVLSKNITNEQIKLLEQLNIQNKKLIFILDKDKINIKYDFDLKGIELGKVVLSTKNPNWKVSYPKFRAGIKDLNESNKLVGKLETYDAVIEGIVSNSTDLLLKTKLANANTVRRI